MTTAYHARPRRSCRYRNRRRPVGGGETGRTTAHLTAALDDRYYRIRSFTGRKAPEARSRESHSRNRPDRNNCLPRRHRLRFRARRRLPLSRRQSNTGRSRERAGRYTPRRACETLRWSKSIRPESWNTGPALRFPRQAQFHPLKYLNGPRPRDSSRRRPDHSHTHAEKIEDGEPAAVTTSDGHVITADDIVVATNSPVNDWVILHTKQSAYRTYVIGARVPRGAVPQGPLLGYGGPIPLRAPARSRFPPRSGSIDEILIVGGEDHKTGQEDDAEDRFARLESGLANGFPWSER